MPGASVRRAASSMFQAGRCSKSLRIACYIPCRIGIANQGTILVAAKDIFARTIKIIHRENGAFFDLRLLRSTFVYARAGRVLDLRKFPAILEQWVIQRYRVTTGIASTRS